LDSLSDFLIFPNRFYGQLAVDHHERNSHHLFSLLNMAQKASDTDFRRKWDANEFAERAKKRKLEEEEANAPKKCNEPVKRELLKQRDFKVDLDSHVGKIQVVTNVCALTPRLLHVASDYGCHFHSASTSSWCFPINAQKTAWLTVLQDTPMAQQGGFYCDVCDCVLKDSINFLDHINGRKRMQNRHLGSLYRRLSHSFKARCSSFMVDLGCCMLSAACGALVVHPPLPPLRHIQIKRTLGCL
jgi:U4/U6.U5 tri-snRNP component SNU23